MNLKRAIWIAALTYLVSFVIGIIVALGFGLDFSNGEISTQQWIVSIILTVIVTVFFALLYFKDKKIKPSAKEGFYFGIALIIVGAVLDLIFFLIFILGGGAAIDVATYYTDPLFWTSIIALIITTSLTGFIKGKK